MLSRSENGLQLSLFKLVIPSEKHSLFPGLFFGETLTAVTY